MVAWCDEDDGWVDLPGPEDSEIDNTGFAFSNQPSGHYEAYSLIHSDEEPIDGTYDRMFPSSTDLFIMDDSIETRETLKAFLGRIYKNPTHGDPLRSLPVKAKDVDAPTPYIDSVKRAYLFVADLFEDPEAIISVFETMLQGIRCFIQESKRWRTTGISECSRNV